MNLVRAELFKLRTTNAWWVFTAATLVSTVVVLVVDCVNAHALLQSFSGYVALHSHGPNDTPPPDFLARMRTEWAAGHSAITQAATIDTAGQLIGLLLTSLLGIVLVTSEFQQQTATSTFLTTPRRLDVIRAKLVTAVLVGVLAWLASTLVSVVSGAVFLSREGFGSQLGQWPVDRAILLNLAAYVLWAVFGVGFGTLVRSQLGATVSATVLYLVGAAAATSVFELVNTYVLQQNWVLSAQVVVPAVASGVMISPTAVFDQSPAQWVGAVVLIAWAAVFGLLGARSIRRRDIA